MLLERQGGNWEGFHLFPKPVGSGGSSGHMGPGPTNSIWQSMQQICDPHMMRLSYTGVVFMEQTYYRTKVVLCAGGGAQ